MTTHRMTKKIKRLVLRLTFSYTTPRQEALLSAEVLYAVVRDGCPELVVLRPDCSTSYFDWMQRTNTTSLVAVACTALEVSRGALFSSCLIHHMSHKRFHKKTTLAVCCPPAQGIPGILDFPWVRLPEWHTGCANDLVYEVPTRFASSGQMGLVGRL